MQQNTIAAIASPPGIGAVALIRMSGPDVLEIARQAFRPLPASPTKRYQYFGKVFSKSGETIDEVLLTYFDSASFTGEPTVEIACHGGVVVTKCILDRLFELGAAPAQPGEFSQRAFFNGKIDLTQAEAIMDIISAQTELSVRAANQQLSGRLGDELQKMREDLIAAIAHVEAYIDFPEEDIDPDSENAIKGRIADVLGRLRSLLATADQGRILREGVLTVICGAPNAGKSSLLNRLLGFDRAIVSGTAGTTRDTIEESVNIEGIPLRMVDTAGLRESDDDIEQQGIERTRQQIDNAELVLQIVDASMPRSAAEIVEVPEQIPSLLILNKVDLAVHSDWSSYNQSGGVVEISCLDDRGIDSLRGEILERLTGSRGGFDRANLAAINARHQSCLKQAEPSLERAIEQVDEKASPEYIAFEIREGLDHIGQVIGKTDIEEILGEIFGTFCIGK
ncbi:MAG: tRNA uridine-5-carboxymethylaminomethyl(34) synthesis GTPase MnmE [Verrucomicrobiota bacterium]